MLQTALTDDAAKNIRRVTELVREAAGKGADVILPSELFEGHYFCKTQDEKNFAPRARMEVGSRRHRHGEAGEASWAS